MTSARDRSVKPGGTHRTESRRSDSVLLTPLAIPAYKRVLARDPKNTEALTHVGLILYSAHILYETKKDPAGAAKSLETFLTLIPQGQDTDRARTLLAEIRRSGAAAKR